MHRSPRNTRVKRSQSWKEWPSNTRVSTKSDPDKVAKCEIIKPEGTTEIHGGVPISQVRFFMSLFEVRVVNLRKVF